MAMAQAFRTLRHAFHRVADQTIDLALVPVENSQAGSILETYDLLLEYRSLVVAEVALQVDHCLLILPEADRRQVKRVLSHPQALAQCEAFIVREGLEPIPIYDTAGAARQVQRDARPDEAAIAGRRAGELYGLTVAAERIQTVQENITRFFLISRRGAKRPRRPVAAASAADRPRSPERVRPLRSAGVLQAGRDPIDRSQDRLEVATPTGIVDRKATQLAQQPHLEVTHRIDVGIAQAQAGE